MTDQFLDYLLALAESMGLDVDDVGEHSVNPHLALAARIQLKLMRAEKEEKASNVAAYNKGKEDGDRLAKQRLAIQLVNIYYDTSYKWWNRNPTRIARMQRVIDHLWARYGPVEHDNKDDY